MNSAKTGLAEHVDGELAALLDLATEAVITVDQAGRITRANPAALADCGFDPTGLELVETVEQLSIRDLSGELIPLERFCASQALRGEKVSGQPVQISHADGTRRRFLASAAPVQTGGERSGAVLAWSAISEIEQPLEGITNRSPDWEPEEAQQVDSQAALQVSQALEQARAAELEAVLDAVPAVVWIAHDSECCLITGNRASYEFLRMTQGTNQSMTAPQGEAPLHFRVFHDGRELAPEELPLQVSAREGIEIRDFEEEILFEDGQVRNLIGNVTPLLDSQGRPRGAVAAFVDITGRVETERALRASEEALHKAHEEMEGRVNARTSELAQANAELRAEIAERRRAEAALEASKEMFEQLFQSAPDPIILVDDRGRVQRANRQTVEQFGYAQAELLGEPVEILLPERLRAWHAAERARYLDGPAEEPFSLGLDLSALCKDGMEIPIDITLSPMRTGEQLQVIYVLHDITPRKQAETLLLEGNQALHRSEARFRAIFEQSPLGIQLLDLDGNSLEWNVRFHELLGYTTEELQRMRFLDYTYFEDLERNRNLFDELIAGARDHYNLEKRFVRKDGQVIWGRLSAGLALDERGEPLFIVKIVEDINDRKQIEAELEELQRRFIDSVEAERLLIARDLHDGPVQDIFALVYNLALLTEAVKDPDHQSELKLAKEKLSEVNSVLRGIMRELRPPTLSPFGLEKAIQDHVERLAVQYPGLDVHLDLMADGTSLSERLRLALFRIYQVAIHNVVRHAKASQVGIRLRLDPEQVFLEIWDDGLGFEMPERWIGLVRQGQYGLVGAAERAEAVGGRLAVTSRPGEGTRVRVSVPNGVEF